MKKLLSLFFSFSLAIIAFIAYGFSNADLSGENVENDLSTAQETKFPEGKKIYEEKCIVCHQANGEGITGAFPPLANADYLLEDKVRAVEQVLNGSNEEMVVNGVTYRTPMPPQVDNKEDAVAVVNYILNTWGNDGGTVTMEEVEHIKIKR